ncbi:hypothetical protein VCUG_00608 [Vavraia culicis subsp. floridensis]|uniref:Uncharacterized protein n=1 Tax=Vavraia culicis (isolate floridensis) TaxID=948595 RepID=L2GX98_VAVCU|nr:uncharacterized protein VCUG_00608 [Vavraia culicis subsp. floridensis]ELA47888.1 hypothetical protein VCUG_00608 [Vavraia culicis subsp. floridensis]
MNISRHKENTFDVCDICYILPHLSMFGELRKGILAFYICMHLQNNNTLLQDMINYKNNSAEHACAHPTKLFSSLLLSNNENATYFREIANSYIVFNLIDQNGNSAKTRGNSLKM